MVTCATTSRVRQPSHNDGSSHTPGPADANRSARARYSSATSEVMPAPDPAFRRARAPRAQAGEIGSKPIERGEETGLRFGGQERFGHVGLMDPDLGALRAERSEVGAHAHARVHLGPDQQLGRAHVVEDGPRRVLASVGVVDHHGFEHAPGSGVQGDAVPRCTDARRPPEVGEMVRVGHATEDELAGCVEDPAEVQLAGGARLTGVLSHGSDPFASGLAQPWRPVPPAGLPAIRRACRSARPISAGSS